MSEEKEEAGVNVLGDQVEDEENETTEDEQEEKTYSEADYNKLMKRFDRLKRDFSKLKESSNSAPSDDDVEATKEAVRKEEADRYKTRIVKAEAKAKLKEAGAKGDTSKLVRLINMDEIDLGDDDEIEGLDDEIDTLKSDYPELFEPATIKADPRTKKDAADKPPAKGAETWEERMAKAMRG